MKLFDLFAAAAVLARPARVPAEDLIRAARVLSGDETAAR